MLAALVIAIRSPRVVPTARLPWVLSIVLTNAIGAVVFFGWFSIPAGHAAPQA